MAGVPDLADPALTSARRLSVICSATDCRVTCEVGIVDCGLRLTVSEETAVHRQVVVPSERPRGEVIPNTRFVNQLRSQLTLPYFSLNANYSCKYLPFFISEISPRLRHHKFTQTLS